MDECANSCWTVEAGIECCVDKHGRGLDEYWKSYVAARCEVDCSTDGWLSEPAAACIAQVHGLPSGDIDCFAMLSVDGAGATWRGLNVLEVCEEGGGIQQADVIELDVESGEKVSRGWIVGECN